jgi:hypothetical protein
MRVRFWHGARLRRWGASIALLMGGMFLMTSCSSDSSSSPPKKKSAPSQVPIPGADAVRQISPAGWVLRPLVEGSRGQYRFGVLVDGSATDPTFKFTGDLETEKVIYCMEEPLTNCAEGRGQFFVTSRQDLPNLDYRQFTAMQDFPFGDGLKVVIIGLDANNQLRSESYGVLERSSTFQ